MHTYVNKNTFTYLVSATQLEEWIEKKIKIQKIPEIQASVNDVILYHPRLSNKIIE